MPSFSTTGKGVLAFTIAHFAKAIFLGRRAEEQRARDPTPAAPPGPKRVCGYTVEEIDAIYERCKIHDPDWDGRNKRLSLQEKQNLIRGILTCNDSIFRDLFGFSRPDPGG